MNLFILYKYYNYGTLSEKKEVMCVTTEQSLAIELSDKYRWDIENIISDKIRIQGGPFKKDEWKDG